MIRLSGLLGFVVRIRTLRAAATISIEPRERYRPLIPPEFLLRCPITAKQAYGLPLLVESKAFKDNSTVSSVSKIIELLHYLSDIICRTDVELNDDFSCFRYSIIKSIYNWLGVVMKRYRVYIYDNEEYFDIYN